VPPGDQLVDDLVDAILDGAPIDWPAAESRAESTARPLVRQLRLLAAVAAFARSDNARASASLDEAERRWAELHRGPAPSPPTLALGPSTGSEPEVADGRVLWGHLRLVERVGRGAFGEVYRAWDTRLDREVALKLLPAGSTGTRVASSIIQEGRLLAKVRHPNVVTIHGAEQIGDRIGLWMEFVRGHTLEQILDGRKLVSADETVDIGVELCRAMSAVHGAGLLHRDIKTHNVMRAEDGRIVLMDFGTGRELDADASSDLAGTPLYLAPEILDGQQATVHSDIYSLGVLLYHIVTGSYPVRAQTVRGVRRAHERGERTAVRTARRGVRRKLARVIERAIDPRPERRYESADAMGTALGALRPRPRIVRLAYAAGMAPAAILLAGVGWEVAGRQLGASSTPTALLAGFASFHSAGTASVDPVERPVIVVLPFKNLSAQPDTDYFVDGLTDEIIRNLAVVQGLQVRSRTSSFAFKDKPRNLQQVAEQLGANLIVEGSAQRDGNRLRISAQLVRVEGDAPLWSDRYDRELKDIFAIQDEISRVIVSKLRLTLGKGQRRYHTNLEAYELYLKARELVDQRATFPAQQAVKLFEQAIARDRSFALAYAGLADAYATASVDIAGPFMPTAIPPETALPLIVAAAETALQLDPLLAEAHAAMGLMYSRKLDWQKAEESFRSAINLNPSLTHIHASYSISTLIPLGKLTEAEQGLRSALLNDPLSLSVQRELAWLQFITGRYEEAIDGLERIRAVDPHFSTVDIRLARALTFAGRPVEALRVVDAKRARPGVQPWIARAYVMVGQSAEVERLVAMHDHPLRLAVIYAALGDKDRTFAALDQAAVRVPHRVGLLLRDPEMAALRDDPRFAAVRKKLGLP
jgi:TolB-like protein/Tfp pilus assembly protein PilF/tRNA A-37 threonylcarbamoyl transferase component Bud32